ncbi:DUF5810 domain-containing protein [Natronomonas sp.]|uniref:DUF5810 domain-containing protein n=1 Tax=Natronomonas sp. TaxID=2184060 RepID=UPI0026166F8E|nr:DUF5810 domain-containing protein [Natronomonas sp.]
MGYACPVCSDPQADAGHLANHLAFTALLGDDDHEAWLEEHAAGWGGMSEDDLAEVVSERVEETEFQQVFEDTVGGLDAGEGGPRSERSGALFDDEGAGGHDHSHDHGRGHDHDLAPDGPGDAAIDDATAEVLEEARRMTEEMLEDEEGGSE